MGEADETSFGNEPGGVQTVTVDERVKDGQGVNMEIVLKEIGGFGKFQIILALLTIYPQLPGAMIIFSPVFTATSKVAIYCSNHTVALPDDCQVECVQPPQLTVENEPVFSSIVQEWELVCSRSWIPDAITSCQMAGMMVGSMVSSLVAERYGRRPGYFFVIVTMGVSGVLPAIATSPALYAAGRFLAGFGEGGCLVVPIAYLMEFLTPSWRVICAWLPLWCGGQLTLAVAAYLIPSWRYLTIASALPAFLVLPFYPYIQESPRWLLTRGRTKEAYQVLRRIARWNSRPAPTVVRVEELQRAVLLDGSSKGMSRSESVKLIWANRELRRQLLVLNWLFVSGLVVYYGVSFNAKSLSGDPYLNCAYMGSLSFAGVTGILVLNNRLGRRTTLITAMALASILALFPLVALKGWAKEVAAEPMLVTGSVLLVRCIVDASLEVVRCIILESFPTSLRASSLGVAVVAGYLGAILAPQTAYLSQFSESIPYMIYFGLALSSAALAFFLRETAGVPLQDSVSSGNCRKTAATVSA